MTYSQSKMARFGLGGACAVLLAGFSAITNQSVMEHASSVLRKHGIPVSSNDNRRSSEIVHRLVAPAGTRPPVRLLPNVITGEFGSTIYFSGECSEEVIEAIRVIQNCPTLILDGASITDSQLGSLQSLHQLETLSLNATRITDRGVRSLAQFPQLKWVALQETQISDDSVESLLLLTELECLRIAKTLVTDDGVKRLAQLRHLYELGCPQISDEIYYFLRKRFPRGGITTESN